MSAGRVCRYYGKCFPERAFLTARSQSIWPRHSGLHSTRKIRNEANNPVDAWDYQNLDIKTEMWAILIVLHEKTARVKRS